VAPGAAFGADIVGLELGMSQQQLNAALTKHDASMSFKTSTDYRITVPGGAPESSPRLLRATKKDLPPGDSDSIGVLLSPPGSPLAAIWIRRDIETREERAPTAETVLASLHSKYGQPTQSLTGKDLGPYHTVAKWRLDTSRPSCIDLAEKFDLRPGSRFDPRVDQALREWLAPGAKEASCSPEVVAFISARSGSLLATHVVVHLIDVDRFRASKEQYASYEAQRKKEIEAERAKSAPPAPKM
jgi:hypothetical protein